MPYSISTILKPIQFDDPEHVALQVAKQIATQYKATLQILHVVPILPAIGEPSVALTAHTPEEEKARKELQGIADKYLSGVKYEILTRVASTAETAHAIVQTAREINADLIVMKTHGRQGLAHMIVGSVAEHVVREAPCAVLTLTSNAQARFKS